MLSIIGHYWTKANEMELRSLLELPPSFLSYFLITQWLIQKVSNDVLVIASLLAEILREAENYDLAYWKVGGRYWDQAEILVSHYVVNQTLSFCFLANAAFQTYTSLCQFVNSWYVIKVWLFTLVLKSSIIGYSSGVYIQYIHICTCHNWIKFHSLCESISW